MAFGDSVVVHLDPDQMAGGDSGGPWFFAGIAGGTHVGRFTWIGNERYACFSRAANMARTPMGIDVVARERKVRNDILPPGGRIWPADGQYFLEMQSTDGNLVLFTAGLTPLWDAATGPNNPGNFAIMQADGKLRGVHSSRWHSCLRDQHLRHR